MKDGIHPKFIKQKSNVPAVLKLKRFLPKVKQFTQKFAPTATHSIPVNSVLLIPPAELTVSVKNTLNLKINNFVLYGYMNCLLGFIQGGLFN